MDYKQLAYISNELRGLTLDHQIVRIKHSVNPGQYKEVLRAFPVIDKHLKRNLIYKSIDEIIQRETYGFTEDIKREYRWLVNQIDPHLELINEFVTAKLEFEKLLLREEFASAKEKLGSIETKIGISLWTVEASILLEELMNGAEANWNKLSDYLKQISNPFYEFIINHSSKRFEFKLSYEAYITQFQNDISTIDLIDVVRDFFVFKNVPFASYDYSNPGQASTFFMANIFSVIDQYLVLMDAIAYNVSVSGEFNKLFSAFIANAAKAVPADRRIYNIQRLFITTPSVSEFMDSDELIVVEDLYYTGDFASCLAIATDKIKKYPTEFQFYELYCKSLINLGREFEKIGGGTLINDILVHTYNILKFEKGKEDSFKRLFKYSICFQNTTFGKQIHGMLSEIEGETNRNFLWGIVCSQLPGSKSVFLRVVRHGLRNEPEQTLAHPSLVVQQYRLGVDIELQENYTADRKQLVINQALHYFNRKEYAGVIAELLKDKTLDSSLYYYERKISLLFNSYLELNQLENALILLGEIFFDEQIVTRKINHLSLYTKIKNSDQLKNLESNIIYSILCSMIVKEYDLYVAFDEFMVANGFDSLSDISLQSIESLYSKAVAIYFFDKVTTIDTLKYSTDYGSISDVEEVRINILSELMENDPINRMKYEKERNEIYRINSVRKVLKEVDEGRLYIDINSLKDIQIKRFKDEFNRFKEIELSSSGQSLIAFNAASAKNWTTDGSENMEAIERYNAADYLAFKSIYLESRDNFLFSKEYGLDSCLSTRIRHGALKNHIRSVFEKLELVTAKSNDIYQDNAIWAAQLSNHPDLNLEVQSILKEFSREIDNYSAFIVDKLIQVQTEKTTGKDDGLFSFFTNDEVLFSFYKLNSNVLNSIQSTIDIILTSLTNHTLVDLQRKVVSYFERDIVDTFQGFIDTITNRIRALNLPSDCQLVPNLIKSTTDIQAELESIANWFYLNTTSSTTLLSIQTVLDASIELTNKINPSRQIQPIIEFKCDPFGVYSSLVFVFNILFNNILQHSKLSPEEVEINILVDVFDEMYFRVSVSNTLNLEEDFTENLQKLEQVKLNWNDHSRIEKSNTEGESGFDKIKRILLYETFSKTDKFDFSYSDNRMVIELYFPYSKI